MICRDSSRTYGKMKKKDEEDEEDEEEEAKGEDGDSTCVWQQSASMERKKEAGEKASCN